MHTAEGKALQVAVAGGSIGGLCAATALRSVGCEVDVYERTPHEMTSRGAGIVVQPALMALLREVGAPTLPTTGCSRRLYLEPTGGRGAESGMPQRFTSWEAIYRTLVAASPPEHYHLGAEVIGFEQDGAVPSVAVRFGSGATVEADLLVCADGWRSPARNRLMPHVEPEYAGYVAWRGTLDEVDAPGDLAAFFDDRFAFSEARSRGHALCYLIPGENAATEPGRRRLNWVWYMHIEEGQALAKVLTDRSGDHHTGSVPLGQVRDDVAAHMWMNAESELHSRFAELIVATPEPFLQVILDLAVPHMLFGRICLLGDAAFIVRPHTAGATAKAAADALTLAQAAKSTRTSFDAALGRWEQEQLAAGQAMSHYGVLLGRRFAATR
jgi:2-polyprenyl-6-methoxyphenol hydroxylase-like FAD-dependent oxidoreductase